MKVIPTELHGVLIIEPTVFSDERGWFFESYHAQRYAAAGLPTRLVRENHSRSAPGTLRGLHYQLKHPQGKDAAHPPLTRERKDLPVLTPASP